MALASSPATATPDSSSAPAATAEGTRAHAQAMTAQHGFAAWAYRPLGRTGLTVSALGFGGYRVEGRGAAHRAALELALRQGINLVDTSSNYTDGDSEQLIGEVLARQVLPRDRVVVVSKVGYVQGQNMSLARRAQEQGKPFPEMVEYQSECWHCIHPEFLRDQLQRSLQRLGLASLDVYLLHNPEYFLLDWAHRHPQGDLAAARAAFYGRMQSAFAELERMAQAGSIRWYGVSSNSFGLPEQSEEFVSLASVWEAAQAAAAEVHGPGAASRLAVVQCPLNLLESGPALMRNQPGSNQTFLELAQQAGLGVLVNRPLNAIQNHVLVRLALPPRPPADVPAQQERALDALLAQELEFAQRFRPSIQQHLPPDASPLDPFNWSHAFREVLAGLDSTDAWLQMLHTHAFPQVQRNAQAVSQALTLEETRGAFGQWFQGYAKALQDAAERIFANLQGLEHQRAQGLHGEVQALLPEGLREQPLARQALLVACSTPGVSCVLNGMRQPDYVQQALAVLALPELDGPTALAALRHWSRAP